MPIKVSNTAQKCFQIDVGRDWIKLKSFYLDVKSKILRWMTLEINKSETSIRENTFEVYRRVIGWRIYKETYQFMKRL